MFPPSQHAVLTAIHAVRGLLSVAEALVRAERAIDLTGLEKDVAALCEAAVALPLAQGRAVRQDLLALLAQVEGLEARFLPP